MARLPSIRRRLRRFAQVGNRRRALLAEAVAWLLLTRLALLLVPFPRLARRLGTFVPPSDARAVAARRSGAPSATSLAEEIGWAVPRATCRSTRSACRRR